MTSALVIKCLSPSDIAAMASAITTGPFTSGPLSGTPTGVLSDGTVCTWVLEQTPSGVFDPLSGAPLSAAVFGAIFFVFFVSFGIGVLSTSLDK